MPLGDAVMCLIPSEQVPEESLKHLKSSAPKGKYKERLEAFAGFCCFGLFSPSSWLLKAGDFGFLCEVYGMCALLGLDDFRVCFIFHEKLLGLHKSMINQTNIF